LVEVLDSKGRGVPEQVDALVIISCHPEPRSRSRDSPDKFLVTSVQILELINYQFSDSQQVSRADVPLPHLLNASPYNFTWKDTGVQCCRLGMERLEICLLRRCYWRQPGLLEGLPECVVGVANLLSPSGRASEPLSKLTVKNGLLLPLVSNHRIDREHCQ
jgi:hypothetical protein